LAVALTFAVFEEAVANPFQLLVSDPVQEGVGYDVRGVLAWI
jgi:hypothetical protein